MKQKGAQKWKRRYVVLDARRGSLILSGRSGFQVAKFRRCITLSLLLRVQEQQEDTFGNGDSIDEEFVFHLLWSSGEKMTFKAGSKVEAQIWVSRLRRVVGIKEELIADVQAPLDLKQSFVHQICSMSAEADASDFDEGAASKLALKSEISLSTYLEGIQKQRLQRRLASDSMLTVSTRQMTDFFETVSFSSMLCRREDSEADADKVPSQTQAGLCRRLGSKMLRKAGYCLGCFTVE